MKKRYAALVLALALTTGNACAGEVVPPAPKASPSAMEQPVHSAAESLSSAPVPSPGIPPREKAPVGGKSREPEKPSRFVECDQDRSGALSRDEFMACFPRSAVKFDAIDVNKNGVVSEQDFQDYQKKNRTTKKAEPTKKKKGGKKTKYKKSTGEGRTSTTRK